MSQHRLSIYGATRAYENSDDAARMSQQIVSRDEETRASENSADDKWKSQRRVSRDGSTHASENADHAEQMNQRRASIDEATRASENASDYERSFFFLGSQHCSHTHNSSLMDQQWEDFIPYTAPLNYFLRVHNSPIPKEDLRSSDNRFRGK